MKKVIDKRLIKDFNFQKYKEKEETKIFNNTEPDIWTSNINMITECSKAPESVKVKIHRLVSEKISILMDLFPTTEWLGYLTGMNENDIIIVNDILIPTQTASSGSVTNIDFSVPNGISIIGVIHSHHGIGAFFSGTDNEWINQNHNLSIVVSKDKMLGQVRWKTPCNGLKIINADISIDFGLNWDREGFIKNTKELITQPVNNFIRWYDMEEHKIIPYEKRKDIPIPKELCGVNRDIKIISDDYGICEDLEDNLTFEEEIKRLESGGMLSIKKYE